MENLRQQIRDNEEYAEKEIEKRFDDEPIVTTFKEQIEFFVKHDLIKEG